MTDPLTTEQVAWEQSISVEELLDGHFRGRDPGLVWTVEDIPVAQMNGIYEPSCYYEDEGDYMAALEAAMNAGDVPLPAFVKCGRGYDHADGAHRLIVAIHRDQTTIRSYVAVCPLHETT